MTVTITGTSAHAPSALTTYRVERRSRNLVSEIPGTSDTTVSLKPAGLRRGTHEAVFESAAAAHACADDLAGARTFTLEHTEVASVDMTFVIPNGGVIAVELNPATRVEYLVRFDFQEITAS